MSASEAPERRFDVLTGTTVVVAILLNLSILSLRGALLGGDNTDVATDAELTAPAEAAMIVGSADGELAAAVVSTGITDTPGEASSSQSVAPTPQQPGSQEAEPPATAPDAVAPSAEPTTTPAPTTAPASTSAPAAAMPVSNPVTTPTPSSTAAPTPTTTTTLLTFEVEDFSTVVIADHGTAGFEMISVTSDEGWFYGVEKSSPTQLELKFFHSGEDEVKWRLTRFGGELQARVER